MGESVWVLGASMTKISRYPDKDVVDLDGGGDVKANVVNVEPDPEHVKLGMKVRLTTFVAGTDDEGTEAVVFGFEPA